jgi:ligand-binding SRPBCC domain-containing protein
VPSFVKSIVIDAPIERVFGFHERDDALALLSPAFPPVRLISRTGGIEVGAKVVLQVGIFRWVALHTAFVRDALFVDRQIAGPFAEWVHRHEFENFGARTRLTDRIEYALPGGALVNGLLNWAVIPGLERMFAHRHKATKEFCEKMR